MNRATWYHRAGVHAAPDSPGIRTAETSDYSDIIQLIFDFFDLFDLIIDVIRNFGNYLSGI